MLTTLEWYKGAVTHTNAKLDVVPRRLHLREPHDRTEKEESSRTGECESGECESGEDGGCSRGATSRRYRGRWRSKGGNNRLLFPNLCDSSVDKHWV